MKLELYSHLLENPHITTQANCVEPLHKQLKEFFFKPSHGHFNQWLTIIDKLSPLKTQHCILDKPIVEIGSESETNDFDQQYIKQLLKSLAPWRKGPFNFFDNYIDSEWRCDLKWRRVQTALPNLRDKTILDVGCGNGYYMLRMLGQQAKLVIGVDPTLIFLAQYYALTQSLKTRLNAHLLPFTYEHLPYNLNQFDIVFSMGVLYHRRDPFEHLQRLFSSTIPGGTVIIETLIIDSQDDEVLIPEERYADMRNVWSIPSIFTLKSWLTQTGFINVEVHNIQTTDLNEQRKTEWTKNFSLENFIDSNNLNKTIEGHPAPIRAILSATRP